MDIIQIGLYPPPYGGVSIHINRLHEKLLIADFKSFVVDISSSKNKKGRNVISKYGKFGWVIPLFLHKEKSIFHFHNCNVLIYILSYFFSLKHIVILSVHNPRNFTKYLNSNFFSKFFYKILLKTYNYIILDNDETLHLGEELIKSYKGFLIIPEFIPPAAIPPIENLKIKEIREKHKFILTSNAWKICFYKEEDLYGIDLLIDLTHTLRNKYSYDLAFIFLLPQIGDQDYFQILQNKIKKLKIEDFFLFILEPLPEASSLWLISDVVIRATNTDGNSLTVLEALSCNVPVLASDCCERYPKVHLFKSRNIESLVKETIFLLNSTIKNQLNDYPDNFKCFQQLYCDIISSN